MEHNPAAVARYLSRLGRPDLAGAPADIATLVALHRAHVGRIPYDTTRLVLGLPDPCDAAAAVGAFLAGRGGYCFHLNTGFGWLLTQFGYAVAFHRAGVQSPRDPGPVGANGNHLALVVAVAGQRWLVDVGLGSALHSPIPLVANQIRQGPFVYGLRPSDVEAGGWRFDHDPSADSFVGFDVAGQACSWEEATTRHTELSTSPDSPFVRALAVQRRDASGVDLLRWTWLVRIDESGWHERVLSSADELAEVCGEVFGLALDGISTQDWEALYAGQAAAYERARARRAAR